MLKAANVRSIGGANGLRVWSPKTVELISRQLFLCLACPKQKTAEPNPTEFPKPAKKQQTGPKITLISPDQSISVVTLDTAQKISKRRDLKLVQVLDVEKKTERPVYKLLTGTEYFEEDLKRRSEKQAKKGTEIKDPKLVNLSSKISDHDVHSKIKNIVKWLRKRHEVRIVIECGDNTEVAERIANLMETETKDVGKMVQKRQKGNVMKFQLMPLNQNTTIPSKTETVNKSPENTTSATSEINSV